jgi:hypothetical protein
MIAQLTLLWAKRLMADLRLTLGTSYPTFGTEIACMTVCGAESK